MYTVSLDVETSVSEEADLRRLFGTDRIYLVAGASVSMIGEITLGPEVTFAGACRIAGPVLIDKNSSLTDVRLGRDSVVRQSSILTGVEAGERNLFGPFCFIRDGCAVGDACILGAHVEAARSRFANGVKISHRAFVGDADIGPDTIIGAGVVFCNWDGARRQPATVGSNATIGSGSLLVAPILIGDGAIIAAGSTVTKNVPAGEKLIQKR